jgi:A/G-specific adenine glycosylase
MENNLNFSKILLKWNRIHNNRIMPWKGEKNPYKIWLSEIILQQTRVEQGLSYYNKFIYKYPTVDALANASDNEVFKMWEGLGYYSRCKNLIETAKVISNKYAGVFPNTYNEILALKGIGAYTAAAITSFAYNLPYAVVDGNVTRVLSRYFGIKIAIDTSIGKKHYAQLAQSLLPINNAAFYNQAIMDFGATVCKPKLPTCNRCTFNKTCIAYTTNKVSSLPIKEGKLVKKKRFFYYILASYNNMLYVNKRTEKDIWANLWEFILFEQAAEINTNDLYESVQFKKIINKNFKVVYVSDFYKQQLTHQTIKAKFIHIVLKKPLTSVNFEMLPITEIAKLAFPRIITQYFEKNGQSLI